MNSWERFDETLLPHKGDFHSNLDMEDITDADYKHAKKCGKAFKKTIYVNIMICSSK